MNCLGWTIQGINKTWRLFLISFFIFFGLTGVEIAQAQVNVPGMSINFGQGADLVDSLQVLILFTVLTLAPAIISCVLLSHVSSLCCHSCARRLEHKIYHLTNF
jgi:flagellar biosynthesis protein FliP